MALELTSAAVNELLDDFDAYNPATGLYERSTYVQPQRTNSIPSSEDANDTNYQHDQITVATNQIAPPVQGAGSDADLLQEDGTAGTHQFRSPELTMTQNAKQAGSVFLKASGRHLGRFYFAWAGGAQAAIEYDLNAGTASTLASGGGVVDWWKMDEYENGWWRLKLVGHETGTATTGRLVILFYDGSGAGSYTGDGSSGVYWFGHQWEIDRDVPGIYIPTTGAAATRSADSAFTRPWSTTVQEFNGYLRYIYFGYAHTMQIWSVDSDRIEVQYRSGGDLEFNYDARAYGASGVDKASFTGAAGGWNYGDLIELRVRFDSDGSLSAGYSRNGSAETTASGSNATNPLPGSWPNTMTLAGNASRPVAYPKIHFEDGAEKTMAEMRTLAGY